MTTDAASLDWETCTMGSCHRHQWCMYRPCRNRGAPIERTKDMSALKAVVRKPLPTPEQLREAIDYNAETGVATWRWRHDARPSNWNARYAGKPALSSINDKGYQCGSFRGRIIELHRAAWAIHYGAWPVGQIDHINGVRSDNRIINLRVVTNAENARNQKRQSRNTSGQTGVCWHSSDRKWRAQISANGKRKFLGRFDSMEAAIEARRAAERAYGYHENHGASRNG